MNARTIKKILMKNRTTHSVKRAVLTVRVPMVLLPPRELSPFSVPDSIWFRTMTDLLFLGKLVGWPILIALAQAGGASKGYACFIEGNFLFVTYNVKWFQVSAKTRFCAMLALACEHARKCGQVIRVLKRPRSLPEIEEEKLWSHDSSS